MKAFDEGEPWTVVGEVGSQHAFVVLDAGGLDSPTRLPS